MSATRKTRPKDENILSVTDDLVIPRLSRRALFSRSEPKMKIDLDYTSNSWENERWPNFSFDEMKCKQTGECKMNADTMDRLQALRHTYKKGLYITSGYRSKLHKREAEKILNTGKAGSHNTGRAADILIRGAEALRILTIALDLGWTGIGVSQKGQKRFIHLDDIQPEDNFHAPRPTIWSY